MPNLLPTVLAIDSSGARCAAGLWRNGVLLAGAEERMEKGHAERLMPLVAGLLETAALDRGAISLIAVATGPGGFAGPRIGVSAARGLALGLGVPAIGVTLDEAGGAMSGAADLDRLACVAAARAVSGPQPRPAPLYLRPPDAAPAPLRAALRP